MLVITAQIARYVPVVPGGPVASLQEALTLADRIGWPALIKAVGGGGGRAMKQVHHVSQMSEALELAMAEANTAFGTHAWAPAVQAALLVPWSVPEKAS
jgi:acetyl/propionyl-CoA carboxylase alpha subunit